MTTQSTGNGMTGAKGGLTGRQVLAALVLFFGTIVVVNGYMIYRAVGTFGGIDTPDAYRKGVAYNAALEAAAAQHELGWSDMVALDGPAGVLRVELRGRDQQGVAGMKVRVRLARPATAAADTLIEAAMAEPGVYVARLGKGIEPGQWTADVEVSGAPGKGDVPVYRTRRRLWVKP